jgi:hypothetical protein
MNRCFRNLTEIPIGFFHAILALNHELSHVGFVDSPFRGKIIFSTEWLFAVRDNVRRKAMGEMVFRTNRRRKFQLRLSLSSTMISRIFIRLHNYSIAKSFQRYSRTFFKAIRLVQNCSCLLRSSVVKLQSKLIGAKRLRLLQTFGRARVTTPGPAAGPR